MQPSLSFGPRYFKSEYLLHIDTLCTGYRAAPAAWAPTPRSPSSSGSRRPTQAPARGPAASWGRHQRAAWSGPTARPNLHRPLRSVVRGSLARARRAGQVPRLATDSGNVSAYGARLAQRLDGRRGFGQVRSDERPSVVPAVATTVAARRWSAGSAALVVPSPSRPSAVAQARHAPRRCTGTREGPPPGPRARAARPRGDQRRTVDGRVAWGLYSRSDHPKVTSEQRMTPGLVGHPPAHDRLNICQVLLVERCPTGARLGTPGAVGSHCQCVDAVRLP